jgi:hypothetical protein
MIVGHSCTTNEMDYKIPDNVTFITTGICGLHTKNTGLNEELIDSFFDNNAFFASENPEDVLWFDKNHTPPSIKHVAKPTDIVDPAFIVINQSGEEVIPTEYSFSLHQNTPAGQYYKTATWISTKSGIYLFGGEKYEQFSSLSVVSIPISFKDPYPMISVKQINEIFSGSIYPTPEDVISRINEIHASIKLQPIMEDSDKCYLTYYEAAVQTLHIRLPEFINKCLEHAHSMGIKKIRVIDPLCRMDCYDLGTDVKSYREAQEIRRGKSETLKQDRHLPTGLLDSPSPNSRGSRKQKTPEKSNSRDSRKQKAPEKNKTPRRRKPRHGKPTTRELPDVIP